MSKIDRALEITKRLIELEREEKSLRSEFSRLVGEDIVVKTKSPTTEAPAVARGSNAPARIIEFLKRDSTQGFKATDLQKALPDLDIKLIRNTMTRLTKEERVISTERGVYRAQ